MVARFDFDSVSLAQNPKSAVKLLASVANRELDIFTNFDVTASIEENVITLDIAVNDTLLMQMFESTAGLENI
jgi:hypothetical protein